MPPEVETTPPLVELSKVGPCVEGVLRALKFRPHSAPFYEAKVDLPLPKRAPVAAPQPDTSEKGPLTGADIQEALQKNSGNIVRCLATLKGDATAPAQIIAAVTISVSGAVTDASFDPPVANPSVGPCLRKAFKSMKFGKKPKAEMSVKIPLKIQTL